MTEISAFFICVAILAAGDLISTKTKAVIPSVFAISAALSLFATSALSEGISTHVLDLARGVGGFLAL